MLRPTLLLAALTALLLPLPALAADAPNGADTAWTLTATALVLFMTIPGLALFYGGLVRSKNVLSLLMQCFAITCVVSVLWLLYGYSMSFGQAGALNGFFGGFDKALMLDMTRESLTGTLPEVVFSAFQLTFAIITPALVVGGLAERIRFSAVLWFTVLWVTLVYFPLCHWVWGGGWLMERHFMDFAGGTVVHISAGITSLVGALVLGPRRGFPRSLMLPHNLTMTYTGAAMLWVGWYGFNGGSALAANASAGMALLATHMGAAAGALAWSFMEWKNHGKASVLGIVTGMVAGLGTVTPASGFISPLGGLLIGIIAGTVCYRATMLVKHRFKIDDSLDVFPVHGVGGVLGTLLTAVFALPALGGVGYAEGMDLTSQLSVQALGAVAALLYCGVASWVIFKGIDLTVGLRVTPDIETEGLDLALHDERGYNLEPGTM
ncbi:MAG: ammonium transporter [Magnetococcus sp. WYHC-3]